MRPCVLAAAASLLASGSAAAQPEGRLFSPRESVTAAADAAPAVVPGTFALRVRRAERVRRRLYLNSERDYRDQRNLTIRIEPGAVRQLAARHGAPVERYFLGREILVRGAAQRTRIDFTDARGRPTGLYYYQTHVAVRDANRVSVVGVRWLASILRCRAEPCGSPCRSC